MRYSLLVLGVWGLLWMLGLLASIRTHPHVIDQTGLRLRSGFQLDAFIPWEQITTIGHRRSSSDRKLQIEHDQTGVSVTLHGTNNLEVTLAEPLIVRFLDGRQAEVDGIRFYADTPTALIKTAQAHLAHPRSRVSHQSLRTLAP